MFLAQKFVVWNFIHFFLSHQNIALISCCTFLYRFAVVSFSPDRLTFNKEIGNFYSLLRYSIDPFAHLWRWKVRWFVGSLGKFLVYLRFYFYSQDSEETAQAVKAECQQKGVCVCFGGVGNIMGGFIMTLGFWKQES